MPAQRVLRIPVSTVIACLFCLVLTTAAWASGAAKSFTHYLSPTFTVVTEVSGDKADMAKVQFLCDGKEVGKWELKAGGPKGEIKEDLACGFQKVKAGAVLQLQPPGAGKEGSVALDGKLQMGCNAPMPLKIKVAKWPLQ